MSFCKCIKEKQLGLAIIPHISEAKSEFGSEPSRSRCFHDVNLTAHYSGSPGLRPPMR